LGHLGGEFAYACGRNWRRGWSAWADVKEGRGDRVSPNLTSASYRANREAYRCVTISRQRMAPCA
jgi:hypothetical protein